MNHRENENLPAILNAAGGLGTLLISFLVDLRIPLPGSIAKPIGIVIVLSGMSLIVWAATHLKSAFLGKVSPRMDVLVVTGPYRLIRHPIYLGMSLAFIGVAITLRSWPGLLAVFLMFIPSEVYRAKQEEKALHHKFGNEWENYAAYTGFFLPSIGKK